MSLTPPPPIPQRGDPDTFSDRVDAFLTWEGDTLVPELNAYQANLNSIAAGGAFAIPYILLSSTAATGAGGNCYFDGTNMFLDSKDARGKNTLALLAAVNGSTSTVKSYVKVTAQNDPSRWVVYAGTYYVQSGNGLYGQLVTTFVASSNGTVSPFAAGETLQFQFQRTGDKGDTNLVQSALIRQQVASGSSSQSLSVGWNTRVLNTLNINEFGVTLSANQFTLPAGGYVLDASAQAGAAANLLHQLRLFNVTSGSVNDLGGSDATTFSNTTAWGRAHLKTMFTLSAAATFRLDHYVNTASAGGSPVSATGGAGEVYTEVRILKVK